MSTAWVAGTTRAKALVRRRLGRAAARELATGPTADAAVRALADTPYGHDVRDGQDVATAQRAASATLLWHMRILAGWLPQSGTDLLRALAGRFEIANVDGLVLGSGEPPFELGALATAWPRLRNAPDLRAALAASSWGDPGSGDVRSVQLGLRVTWAQRVAALSVRAFPWAAGALALLVARERFVAERPVPERCASLLGRRALTAPTVPEMAGALPTEARWALDEVQSPDELWRAEARWWSRLERDGRALLSDPSFSAAPVLGAVVLLAADTRRVHAALELAARGGGPLEEFDALA